MKKIFAGLLLAVLLLIATVFSVSAAENTNVADGTRVATEAAAMVFPTDGSDLTAVCPVCGVSVTWLPLTPEVLSAGFTAEKANTHYYLTDSVEAAGAKFTMANSSACTSCLHLNGKNIVSTGSVAIEGAAGKLNIMGSGTVKGNGAADNYGSAATVLMANKGSVNLYGGTYEKQTPAATGTNTIGIGWGGGTVAVYSGATVKAGTAGSAVLIDSSLGTANAALNLYGGTIDGTGATARVIDVKEVADDKTNTLSINVYAGTVKNGGAGNVYVRKNTTLNMYGGTISGGTASYGGNIYISGGGTFNLYDGTVTGGVATSNGGNIYATNAAASDVKIKAVMNMYGGTVSGTRDASGNATGGTALNGGNIAIYTSCELNITGGTVENGTAEREGGNIFAKPAYTTKLAEYPVVNLKNVTIRNGKTTVSSNSYGGGNIAFTRVSATIGEGTQILDGVTASRGGNMRLYVGTVVMTGGKISGGIAGRSTGYEEIHMEAGEAKYPAAFYMLGGVIENRETEAEAVRVNAYSKFYLGGNATIADNNPSNAELYIYKASAGDGKLFICDGWTGSATIDGNGITWSDGTTVPSDRIQLVTLDANRKETVGGSFSGTLKNITTGTALSGNSDGTLTIGSLGFAVVDAAGKVTMTNDPLTMWATGDYAFIRLFKNLEIADPAAGMWFDLNGCSLTLSGSGHVNVFDSANDTYQADACGKVIHNGTVTVNQDVTAPNGNRYLALAEGNTTTMHRVELKLTDVTLRTAAAGIYYKAKFACDEALSAKVKSYGVVLSLANMPGEDFLTESDNNQYTTAKATFTSGVTVTSGSVFNIMKTSITDPAKNAARGEMDIYANPYICFDLGSDKIVIADTKNAGKTESAEGFDGIAMSLHDVLVALDDNYFNYDADTQAQVDAFYKQWQEKGMADWEFFNVGQDVKKFNNGNLNFTADSNVAKCPACGVEVTWTPVSQAADTTTKIGVAEAGAHYYLTEDITFTGSGSTGFITGPTAQGTTACLHLNGHDLTSTKAAAIYSPYARMGVLNVMGNGTVSGNASGAGTTVYLSSQKASGGINLYGGTYVKPASNGSSMVALINGGSLHVYDGAWLKGNGSGNAVYMDLAGNAATTFAVHGGKVTGGEVAVAESAGTKARKFIVDGSSYIEEMVIRNTNVAVELSGNPVIDRIALKPNGMLTIGTLTKGAKIGVSTSGLFTKSFAEAADYLQYFFAWNEPDSISVTDAGELCYDINYEHYMTPYIRDVKAQAIADGQIHYYFMAGKGMVMSPTNGGDIDKWGDSCLVVFPNGETMLIDAGYAIQAPVIIGSLKRMGVITLDYLLITHPHNDHIGGAFSSDSNFLDEIAVEQVYYQDIQYGASWDGVLERKCAERNIPYTPLWKGDVLTFGEGDRATTLTMLWPGEEDLDLTIDATTNKHSMVFRFDYGEHSSLFTADIYDYTDKKLIAMYTGGELDVDMMKVPHHGLGTNICSSALLQATTPEIAVATGSFDISATVAGRFDAVGTTLLEDRFHGYIHIASGKDGVMTTETE